MGHERLGLLPKSERWREIVGLISGLPASDTGVEQLADETIRKVQSRLRDLGADSGVNAAFSFLLALAGACRLRNPRARLEQLGIHLGQDVNALTLASALRRYVDARMESLEYGAIARAAATDAITEWSRRAEGAGHRSLPTMEEPFDIWRPAAEGAGFCELSRTFFARLTTRYLRYFLEREASAALRNVTQREEFESELTRHIDRVSRHAFETARITQSFAAGWFNKHVKAGPPGSDETRQFLSFALRKMREELAREDAPR